MKNLKRVLSLALATVMVIGMMVVGANAAFNDQADIKYDAAVDTLVGLGVIDGMGNNTFAPNGTLTRAQAAKMVAYVKAGANENTVSYYDGETKFTDVKANHNWAKGSINYCVANGIIAGMTATMLYNFGAALLRASGDTQRPLYYLFASGVVNVILNLVFVIYFHMDVAGVALATVISQCISAALVVRCLMKETGPLRLDFRQLKIYPIKLKQIMQVGIPAGIQGMLFSLANVTVQSSVNSFGEIIMAGSSAAISIEQFIYSNINAFYQANVAFTSQNYGAGDYRRIKKIAMISVVTGVVTTELLSVLAVYFGPQLLGIYSPSAEVVAAGMVRLRWIALFYGLDAIMDVIVGSLRGVGYNILPMLVTLMGACASRLIWLSTVFRLPAYHRIEMVYIVYPLSWVLTATTHLICYFFVSRKVDRELRAHEAELAARMEESPEEADS